MKVQGFSVNALEANCYIVYSHHQAIIVDPGEASQEILDFIQKEDLEVLAIINTHGHADHIAGNAWFKEKTQAPLWIHELEVAYLSDPSLHLGPQINQEFPSIQADRLLKDGDIISIGQGEIEILHTPGHSPGGISLYSPGLVLTGDTLFKASVGRWDLPKGDLAVLQKSLFRLARLPLDTVVYPGHGASTTIQSEIKHNPFL